MTAELKYLGVVACSSVVCGRGSQRSPLLDMAVAAAYIWVVYG